MMGEVQLPLKLPMNFCSAISTPGHHDLYDSPLLLLPTTPTFKPKLKFLRLLPSFLKKSSSPKTNADSPITPKTPRWACFEKASDTASISDGLDDLHSSSSQVPSVESSPSSTFSIKLDSEGSGDAIERIAGVQHALPKCDYDDEDQPEGPLEVAPQVDYFLEIAEGNGEEELNGKSIEMNKEQECLAFKLPVRLPTLHWERKLRTSIARLRSKAEEMNMKMSACLRSTAEEKNMKMRARLRSKAEEMSMKMSACLRSTAEEMNMKMSARLRSKAEEMNMKMRTTRIDWNGGEVRMFKGEELWYMKELKGMRCRPLESKTLYGDRKSYPLPLLDCRDVYGTRDGDEERPSSCERREGSGRNEAGFS